MLDSAGFAESSQDKEKVAAYKADIKEQLSRMGLIRGQPRQPWHTGLASASQPPTPGVAGPGPTTSMRRSMSAREYRREAGYMRGAPYHLSGLPGPASGKSPSRPCRAPGSRSCSSIPPIWGRLSRMGQRMKAGTADVTFSGFHGR